MLVYKYFLCIAYDMVVYMEERYYNFYISTAIFSIQAANNLPLIHLKNCKNCTSTFFKDFIYPFTYCNWRSFCFF